MRFKHYLFIVTCFIVGVALCTIEKEPKVKLDEAILNLLINKGFSIEFLTEIKGVDLQITLHKEALLLLEQAMTIKNKAAKELLVEATIVGAEANKLGFLSIACELLDFCHQITDYAFIEKDFSIELPNEAWHSMRYAESANIDWGDNKKFFTTTSQDVPALMQLRSRIHHTTYLLGKALFYGEIDKALILRKIIENDEKKHTDVCIETQNRRAAIFRLLSTEKNEEIVRYAEDDFYMYGRFASILSKTAQFIKARLVEVDSKIKSL